MIETRPEKYLDEDFHRALVESARAALRKLQHQAGTDVEVCLEGGDVSTVVRAVALHQDADLAVIGRGKQHETFGRLPSNSYAIIRHSPCPVISTCAAFHPLRPCISASIGASSAHRDCA